MPVINATNSCFGKSESPSDPHEFLDENVKLILYKIKLENGFNYRGKWEMETGIPLYHIMVLLV